MTQQTYNCVWLSATKGSIYVKHVEIIADVRQEFKMNLTYLMETQHS